MQPIELGGLKHSEIFLVYRLCIDIEIYLLDPI